MKKPPKNKTKQKVKTKQNKTKKGLKILLFLLVEF